MKLRGLDVDGLWRWGPAGAAGRVGGGHAGRAVHSAAGAHACHDKFWPPVVQAAGLPVPAFFRARSRTTGRAACARNSLRAQAAGALASRA